MVLTQVEVIALSQKPWIGVQENMPTSAYTELSTHGDWYDLGNHYRCDQPRGDDACHDNQGYLDLRNAEYASKEKQDGEFNEGYSNKVHNLDNIQHFEEGGYCGWFGHFEILNMLAKPANFDS